MLHSTATRWITALVIGSLLGREPAPVAFPGAFPALSAFSERLHVLQPRFGTGGSGGTRAPSRADHGLPDVELLLRAGRPIPPGLTATRAREREGERSAALAKLADRMAADGSERTAWISALASVLASPSDDPELWVCAARAGGELGLYELDAAIAAGLAHGGLVCEAACRALESLFGARPDPTQTFVRPFEPTPGTAYLLVRLRDSEARALALRLALLATDPAIAVSSLCDPHPAVRAEAARVCAAAVRDGRLAALEPQDVLHRQLPLETSPQAFHAQLEALLSITSGMEPGSASVAELRSRLAALSADAPPALMLSLARALARLPWDRDANPLGPTLRAAEQELAALLGRAIATPHGDVDVIAGVLASLQDLFSRIQPTAADADWVRNCEARGPLMRILSRQEFSEGARTAAAQTLALVAVPHDVEDMLRVLRDESSGPGLRYAVLGALAALAETYDETAEPVVATLLEYLDHENADLRRRALALLSSPGLAEHARGRIDFTRVIDRLDAEPVQELASGLLELVKHHGDATMLEPFLAHSSFDKLASGNPARISELGSVLRQLSAKDAGARMKSARRLAQVPDPDTALARLVQSLELVAELTLEEALALGNGDHERIVEWSLELRSAGVLLSEALRGGAAFLRRLVDVHLTRVPDGTTFTLAKRLYARALFLGEIVALGDESLHADTLSSFARALLSASERGDHRLAARVRRDRARYALARDLGPTALEDLRLLAADADQSSVLELRDLRVLAELATNDGTLVDPTSSSEAFDALLTLVRRASWRGEPGAVRLGDLRQLVLRARASGDDARLRAAAELLAGLPSEVAESSGSNGTNGTGASPSEASADVPVWTGLVREPEWLGELAELASSLERALEAPESTEPPPSSRKAESQSGHVTPTSATRFQSGGA